VEIAELKTFVVGNPAPHFGGINWVFLKLITDHGVEGIGEAYGVPFDPPKVAALIEDVGERLVIGSDPFQIEKLWRTLYFSGYAQRPDLTMMGIASAFEMACWDIVGKELNQPVYNLLGGRFHEKLRSYTYLYPTRDELGGGSVFGDPERAAKRAADYVSQGFTAVKFDPVEPTMRPVPEQLTLEALDQVEAVVRNVREAVGSRADILIGTHGQLNTSAAIRLAQRLEKYEPLWFEEPVPPENRDEMARVARSTSIPVATGERLSTRYEFTDVLTKQSASILQMALGRVGGILEAKKIAGMAEAYYADIAPHLYCGPIEGAANVQLGTCSPNFLIQESIETWGGFHAEILKKPMQWEEGYIIPPTAPGLGVELDEEVAARHPYIDVSKRLAIYW
jgi:2-dehydro-3-deoxyphosphogalactonate aldolase